MPESVSFTLRAPELLRAIKTRASISPAFNPITLAANLHPPSVQFTGIWDTGATATAISQAIVDACELKPIAMTQVQTAGGLVNCAVYLVNLTLPNRVCFHNVHVTKADLGASTYLLIGMDIIRQGDFAITNNGGRTCFSFPVPSITTIDFESEAERA